MGKICTSCGIGPAEPKKAPEEKEDCVGCDGEGTVETKKEESDSKE